MHQYCVNIDWRLVLFMNDKVVIALNSLLQELDVILLDFNERFIQLTTQKRLDEAQTALDEAKKIATLQRQIQNLQEEWFHPGPQKRQRRVKSKPEGRTPEWAFRIPILEALVDLGGHAHCQKVKDWINSKMGDQLTEADRETLSDGKTIRWENSVHWERQILVDEGLLHPSRKIGIWEITPVGRETLAKSKE